MDYNSWFLHLFFGPLILITGILYKLFPPKGINYFYGYRTKRSMRNEQTWRTSNKIAANLFVVDGLLLGILQLIFYKTLSAEDYLKYSSISLVVLLVAIIPVIEVCLSKKYDNKGNRRL